MATNVAKVRELLGPNGEGWTKGCYARDKDGRPTGEFASDAVSFCLAGACYRAERMNALGRSETRKLFSLLRPDLIGFNDHPLTTWEDIKALLDEAEKLEQEAAQ